MPSLSLNSIKLRIVEFFLVLITMPVWGGLCLIACLIHLVMHRTNPVFTQQRVGRNQKSFTIYKIRTMHMDTPIGPTHAVSGKHVTFLGGLYRKFKLDELPQLINVMLGDMGFVGPRPTLLSQVDVIFEREKHKVNSLRPGITGTSQISGIDMSDPIKLAASDSLYFGNFTFRDYVRILVETFIGRGSKDYTKC